MTAPHTETIHASCVALNGRAILIIGPSGVGKSSLALRLMAFGAVLVADDRVVLTASAGKLSASAPPAIAGLIEAHGVGILNAQVECAADVIAAVDLGVTEKERLPQLREMTLLGCVLPLFYALASPNLDVSLLQYLKAGRSDR